MVTGVQRSGLNRAEGEDAVIAGEGEIRYRKRDFWAGENLKYAEPHFRMRKVAREARRVTRGHACDLLDIGCGPATLARLMPPGVRYHGIDIAIPEPAPNLIEMDIIEEPVSFRGKKFDVVVAQGLSSTPGHSSRRSSRKSPACSMTAARSS